MKCRFVFALALFLAVPAPGRSELVRRPLVVSFVPSVSTAEPDELVTEATVSLNIIGGRIGAVRGFELGSVFNIEEWDVSGAQVAGTFNIVAGRVKGLQMAGAFNFCGGKSGQGIVPDRWARAEPAVFGAQIAPVNFCLADVRGAQAGWVNVAELIDGVQLGTVNIAQDAWGIGLGVVNIAEAARGTAVGVVNIAERFEGFALGTVNIADSATGFQLGVVNIAGDLEGEALGIVNIIGNGRFCVSAWADETGAPMVGAKLGSQHLYTTYWVGLAPATGARWISGLGLGGHLRFSSRFFADVDITAMSVSDPDLFPRWRYDSPNGFLKLRPQAGFNLTDRVAFVAGPTLSLWLDDTLRSDKLSFFDIGAASGGSDGMLWRAWGGLMAGVEFN
jgi:hypothetical protein